MEIAISSEDDVSAYRLHLLLDLFLCFGARRQQPGRRVAVTHKVVGGGSVKSAIVAVDQNVIRGAGENDALAGAQEKTGQHFVDLYSTL